MMLQQEDSTSVGKRTMHPEMRSLIKNYMGARLVHAKRPDFCLSSVIVLSRARAPGGNTRHCGPMSLLRLFAPLLLALGGCSPDNPGYAPPGGGHSPPGPSHIFHEISSLIDGPAFLCHISDPMAHARRYPGRWPRA
jgi:hypothetical protein